MYAVNQTRPPRPSDGTVQHPHHPVFLNYPCWEGMVPEGFIVNFLGVMTRVAYFERHAEIDSKYPKDRHIQTQYPEFEEEYFEWIDLLEAIAGAKGHFTMLELGAGYGRWTVNAVAALKKLGTLPYSLIAVEAEPTHFQWMTQHFADNAIDPAHTQLVQAAAAPVDGKIGFHRESPEWGGPSQWYGQYIGGPDLVDAVSLNTLLQSLGTVDLIDLDIQGAELQVLNAAGEQVDKKVKRVHIGTHGPRIEEGLRSLFSRLGWRCLYDYPCASESTTAWGTMWFQDGVQTWVNPAYLYDADQEIEMLRERLSSCRKEGDRLWAELEHARDEQNELDLIRSSVGWRIFARAKRLRDWLAPNGTQRRKLYDQYCTLGSKKNVNGQR